MKTLVLLAITIAAAVARPGQVVSVHQDTLGNYNLKYLINGISRVENRDIAGNVNGGYSYVDPYGIVRKTEFTSGIHGYNAVGTDIPLPVQDTPEVAHAKAAHINTVNAIRSSLPPAPLEVQHPELFEHYIPAPVGIPAPIAAHPVGLPAPIGIPAIGGFGGFGVADTPEVIAARAEHFAAHAAAAHAHSHYLH